MTEALTRFWEGYSDSHAKAEIADDNTVRAGGVPKEVHERWELSHNTTRQTLAKYPRLFFSPDRGFWRLREPEDLEKGPQDEADGSGESADKKRKPDEPADKEREPDNNAAVKKRKSGGGPATKKSAAKEGKTDGGVANLSHA